MKEYLFAILALCSLGSCGNGTTYTCQCVSTTTGNVTRSFKVQASDQAEAVTECKDGQQTNETCSPS